MFGFTRESTIDRIPNVGRVAIRPTPSMPMSLTRPQMHPQQQQHSSHQTPAQTWQSPNVTTSPMRAPQNVTGMYMPVVTTDTAQTSLLDQQQKTLLTRRQELRDRIQNTKATLVPLVQIVEVSPTTVTTVITDATVEMEARLDARFKLLEEKCVVYATQFKNLDDHIVAQETLFIKRLSEQDDEWRQKVVTLEETVRNQLVTRVDELNDKYSTLQSIVTPAIAHDLGVSVVATLSKGVEALHKELDSYSNVKPQLASVMALVHGFSDRIDTLTQVESKTLQDSLTTNVTIKSEVDTNMKQLNEYVSYLAESLETKTIALKNETLSIQQSVVALNDRVSTQTLDLNNKITEATTLWTQSLHDSLAESQTSQIWFRGVIQVDSLPLYKDKELTIITMEHRTLNRGESILLYQPMHLVSDQTENRVGLTSIICRLVTSDKAEIQEFYVPLCGMSQWLSKGQDGLNAMVPFIHTFSL